MRIDVPVGEVADRITILELKVTRIADPARRDAARAVLDALHSAWDASDAPPLDALPGIARLREVNAALWDVEDALREHERSAVFDDAFVRLARSVYALNDERAHLKTAIDRATGSALTEPKSYGVEGPR